MGTDGDDDPTRVPPTGPLQPGGQTEPPDPGGSGAATPAPLPPMSLDAAAVSTPRVTPDWPPAAEAPGAPGMPATMQWPAPVRMPGPAAGQGSPLPAQPGITRETAAGWPQPPALGPPTGPGPVAPAGWPPRVGGGQAPPAGWWPPAPPGGGWPPAPPAGAWGFPGAPAGRMMPVQRYGRFRPQTLGELLDGVFTIYRRNFLLIVAIAAVVQVPFGLLEYGIGRLSGAYDAAAEILRISGSGAITRAQASSIGQDAGVYIAFIGAVALVGVLLVQPISQAAVTRAVSDSYLDRVPSFGSAYRTAISRLPALIGMSLLILLIIAAPAVLVMVMALVISPIVLLLVIPGVVFVLLLAVRVLIAPSIIVIEHASPVVGLRRAWSLSRGSFWRIVGLVIVFTVISAILVEVLTLLYSAVAGNGTDSAHLAFQQLSGVVASVITTPLSLIAYVLLYYDLRIRREAFDVEMLAASL